MNPKVTIGFVAVFAVLAGLVFGLDRFNVAPITPGPTPSPTEVPVLTFDDRKVVTFEARVADKTVRADKLSETDWRVAGTDEPANRTTITGILIRMGSLTTGNRVSNPDLAQFGLAEPRTEITATLDDGQKFTLQLGNKVPVGDGVYAKKADAPEVFVVITQLSTDVERIVNDPKEPPTPTPRPSPSATPEGTPGTGPTP